MGILSQLVALMQATLLNSQTGHSSIDKYFDTDVGMELVVEERKLLTVGRTASTAGTLSPRPGPPSWDQVNAGGKDDAVPGYRFRIRLSARFEVQLWFA
jgi:hypothetical protein